ncbi:C6 finger domain protein [Akanthomyces lecanii RCEF 1005]|uniref:C6 finger domain protein n=1 Tax=Akanthomyces lecanii RCEF 1005 TaxID=1081108 RepID=A0A168CTJ5_CORDF|nr:C6 finger domain protein [Akanthomyces lecanii RCEF 1005]
MPDKRRRRQTSQAAFKPRRSHRKSRNGCAECRRRHIRCDKNHPVCFNCNTGDRACVYPAGAAPENPSEEAAEVNGHTEKSPPSQSRSPCQQIPIRTPTETDLHLPSEADVFSATDLLVFHHAHTVMEQVGLGRKGSFHKVLALGMRHRLRAPYLLDQLLALASLHLAFDVERSPETQSSPLYAEMTPESLRHHATARQTRAVASFNSLLSAPADLDMDAARFLFAGVLSLQSLAETLGVLRATDGFRFGDFMDRMVACLNLHRGVRATTGRAMRDFLPQSADLSHIMEVLNAVEDVDWSTKPRGHECQSLIDLLGTSDLGDASLDVCRGAAHSLQWSFDMCRSLSVQDGPHAVSAFAVTAPPGYVEALRRCVPEALIILAYYGVLLHRCREYWIFGDAGARMIRAIADHVGTYWQDAMRWPLQQTGQS